MRLIHLSDLHHQLDWRRRSWWSTGWRGVPGRFELHGLGRMKRFDGVQARIEKLVDDLHALGPDHILLTGDLTSLGDEEELLAVRDLLAPFLAEGRVTVIPGNHDRYTGARRTFEQHFAEQLRSDLPEYADAHGYPFVRLIGGAVAIVGLDSTRVRGWSHYFAGRIGKPQLVALGRVLEDPRLEGRTVLLLSHHGPLGPDGAFDWRESSLIDAGALLEVIRERPVVLHHGHSHQRFWHRAEKRRPHIFGGGSSTERGSEGYWLVDLETHDQLEARHYLPGRKPVD